MEELNAFVVLVGIALMILPAGTAWGSMRTMVKAIKESNEKSEVAISERIDTLATSWDKNHEDTREWLKTLQRKTEENEKAVGILWDRTER